MKKYQIILADPPWNLHGINKEGIVTSRDSPNNPEYNHLNQYKSMSYDDIEKLPIKGLADDNCVLFLWVVDNSLPFVFKLINSWGFVYKTVAFTWVKLTQTGTSVFGMGQWTRNNPEMCLIATKGKIKRIRADIRQLQQHPINKHSKKPPIFRKLITDLVGELPRIELFARKEDLLFDAEGFDGWDVLGFDIDGKDINESIKEL